MGVHIPESHGEAAMLFGSPDPDGSSPEMTFGVHFEATPDVGTAQYIFDTFVSSGCMSTMSSDWSLLGVRLRTGAASGVGPTFLYTSFQAGGEAGQAIFAQCAVLVRKTTNLGGRKGRGRMYFPGLHSTHVDSGGTISSGTLTTLQTAFETFANDLLDSPEIDRLVLLHSAGGPAPTTIQALTVEGSLATQRRRARR